MSNAKIQMPNKIRNPKFDLEERTGKFGEDIIKLVKKAPKNVVTLPILGQLVRSGTGTGANYCEADGAESGRDFRHKMAITKKEAKETKHWLRMLAAAVPELRDEIEVLWKEAHELVLIFSSILAKSKKKKLNI